MRRASSDINQRVQFYETPGEEDGDEPSRTLTLGSCEDAELLRTVSLAQGRLSFKSIDRRFNNAAKLQGTMPRAASSPQFCPKNPPQESDVMPRLDTYGNLASATLRESLVGRVVSNETRPVAIDEGQTGSVFALEVDGRRIAVFKPCSGERFERRGIRAGDGAVREEAVYIVDRLCGSQGGVPVTSRAEVSLDGGKPVCGALQAFHANVAGFADDFGMPHDFQKARAIVEQEPLEALALLDMRVFNMDRHGGNLFFLGDCPPYKLGPIDHGCCLPPWWSLNEAVFDVWLGWPQLECEPSEAARNIARLAQEELPRICEKLTELELDGSSLVTLKLCTLFVFVGVHELGLPLNRLAQLMVRESTRLSWLEEKVRQCSAISGAVLQFSTDTRGHEILEAPGGNSDAGLRLVDFLSSLRLAFQKELPGACGRDACGKIGSSLAPQAEEDTDDEGSPLARSDAPICVPRPR